MIAVALDRRDEIRRSNNDCRLFRLCWGERHPRRGNALLAVTPDIRKDLWRVGVDQEHRLYSGVAVLGSTQFRFRSCDRIAPEVDSRALRLVADRGKNGRRYHGRRYYEPEANEANQSLHPHLPYLPCSLLNNCHLSHIEPPRPGQTTCPPAFAPTPSAIFHFESPPSSSTGYTPSAALRSAECDNSADGGKRSFLPVRCPDLFDVNFTSLPALNRKR